MDAGRRLRVLHVQDKCGLGGARIQGVQRLLLWWWPAFADTDVDLSLVILRDRNEASASFDREGIAVTYLHRSRFDPRQVSDLVALLRRGRFDVVHTHGYGATTFGRLAGALTRTPVVVHEHMVDDDMPLFQSVVDRLTAFHTARAIAVSKAVARFLVTKRHIPESAVEVVYNAIPDRYFDPGIGTDRAGLLEPLGLESGHRHVGIIGRLHPIKGHESFLRAAATVATGRDDVRFVVVGDGELESVLRDRVQQLGISDRVVFLGHQDDIPAVVRTLDLLVVSSISEGFALTAAEAMAGGVPVVATRVGGVPEVVTHGETGLLVPPRDPDALAAAIARLLDDETLRQSMARRAAEVADVRFRIESNVEAFTRIYREVARPR